MRGIAPVGHRQWILAGLVGVGLLDPAIFQKTIDDVIASLDRAVAIAHRMQRRRRFRQGRQVSRFRDGKFVDRFVEIDQRCRGDAVGAKAEIDFVEIEFEDLVLGVGALDPHRQQGFLDLAGERHLVGQKKVLRDLLGNRGCALRPAVGAVILRGKIDAAVLVEILVLGSQKGVDDHFRNRLDRQIQAAFLGIFAEQRAIGGMNARHHRRLIILKLRIVRQVLGKMPDQPRRGGDADQKHHGSGGEQETQKPYQQAHQRISVSTLAPQQPAFSSA